MGLEAPAKRVLVIDSKQSRGRALAGTLGRLGVQTHVSATPDEGWRAFIEFRPEVVLAELLPGDNSGDKFLRRVQGEYMGAVPRTYFLCAADDLAAAGSLEPDGILVPPVSEQSLEAVIGAKPMMGDTPSRQASRLREMYDLSLLGADTYQAIDSLAARTAQVFHASDCVIWGGYDDPNWPRTARAEKPDDDNYFQTCRLAASAGVTLMRAIGPDEGDIVTRRPARSYLASPLGHMGRSEAGALCLVSDQSHRFTADERDSLRVLARRTAHELAWVTAHSRLVNEHEKLRESALLDPMLGVWTRSALEQSITGQISGANRRGDSLCLAVLDYTSLRSVNDRYGHVVGDAVLGHFARTLRSNLRTPDLVGRFGGDELAALLVGVNLSAGEAVLRKVIEVLQDTPFRERGIEVKMAVSAGVTQIASDERTPENAFARALDASKQARRRHKTIEVSDPASDWATPSEVIAMDADGAMPGGATLGGMYSILHEISRGAMGVVYRGEDLGLGRPVAIKVLRSDLAFDTELVGRFRDEAALLASLHHVNLVQVYAFGAEGEDVYFVMELVEGEPLSDVIFRLDETGEFIGLDVVEKIVEEIADALEAVASLGIVHRDVKPANVLLDRVNDRAVLVDVGVAKRREDATDAAGTPGFAAPESFMDENETSATDVYGLAATTYTMLTGAAPFGGGEVVEVVNRQLFEIPRRPSEFREEISPAVDEVLFKALAPEQADRYSSAAAFAIALSRAVARKPTGDTSLPGQLRAKRRTLNRLRREREVSSSRREAPSHAGPPPIALSAPATDREPLVTTQEPQCRGVWFRVAHKLLSHHLGPEWVHDMTNSMPLMAGVLTPKLSPTSWQPLEMLQSVLNKAAESVEDALSLARSLGRVTISATLPRFFGADPATQSPSNLLRAAEAFWSRYHTWGRVSVTEEDDVVLVTIEDSRGDELLCAVTEGAIGRIAELAGGVDVATSHPKCSGSGHESCTFAVRWEGVEATAPSAKV